MTLSPSQVAALVAAGVISSPGGGGGVTPSLNAVSLSSGSATVGVAYSGTVIGRTAGSTLALSGAGAAGLSVDSTTAAVTGTPTNAGSVDVVETLAGATGSPRTSSGVLTVGSSAPSLSALTVSPSSATVGTAFTGTVSGKTSGSTLSLSGAGAAGLSVTGSTISGTSTTAGAVDVIETLAGATGSPRTSSGAVTVAASASAPTNTLAPSISGTPTAGQTLTASDGTWTGSPTFTRQWKADGVAISGQTSSTITLPDNLAGKAITVTVTATNGSGSATATSAATTAVAPNLSFLYDSATYFWDFAANDNTLDTLTTTTLSAAYERVGNKVRLISTNKAQQPVGATGGVNFNQQTDRQLVADYAVQQVPMTNGKNGWYFATTVTPTTGNVYMLEIARNASQTPSRGQLYISSSRLIVLKFVAADGSSVTQVFASNALTLGVKVAIEVQVDLTTGTASLWINGAAQTVTSTGLTAAPFPSTNPYQFTIGNTAQTGGASFDGVMNNVVFYDGIPPSNIRSSISAFEQTRQQAA